MDASPTPSRGGDWTFNGWKVRQKKMGMTNGEMIKAIFPSAEIDIGNGGNDIWIAIDCWTIFKKEWWDAEYKEPTDKKFTKAELDSIVKALNEGWELRVNEVLDKIRAEIKALSPEPTAYDVVDGNLVKDAIWETLIEVDKIIDKYKTESEGAE